MVSKDKPSSLLGLAISDEGKSFITLTPDVNVKNFFSFVTDTDAKKLERLVSDKFLRFDLIVDFLKLLDKLQFRGH